MSRNFKCNGTISPKILVGLCQSDPDKQKENQIKLFIK